MDERKELKTSVFCRWEFDNLDDNFMFLQLRLSLKGNFSSCFSRLFAEKIKNVIDDEICANVECYLGDSTFYDHLSLPSDQEVSE